MRAELKDGAIKITPDNDFEKEFLKFLNYATFDSYIATSDDLNVHMAITLGEPECETCADAETKNDYPQPGRVEYTPVVIQPQQAPAGWPSQFPYNPPYTLTYSR